MITRVAGTLTVDVASFSGDGKHIETLHTGVVIEGHSSGAAGGGDTGRRALLRARAVTGIPGLPDGSIMIAMEDTSVAPDIYTMNVINIDTGVSTSRLFDPGFVPGTGGERLVGWDYFDSKLWMMVSYELRTRTQVVTFPGDLSSQTIAVDETFIGQIDFGAEFFALDAVMPVNSTTFHRIVYSGGFSDNFISDFPGRPNHINHPYSIGLADGKYWTVGGASTSPVRDIKIFTTTGAVDLAASGWTDFGLSEGEVYFQRWFGLSAAGYGWNLGRSAITGFPVWTTPGPTSGSENGTSGFVEIPLTATSWADASFTEVEDVAFDADMVVADLRAA